MTTPSFNFPSTRPPKIGPALPHPAPILVSNSPTNMTPPSPPKKPPTRKPPSWLHPKKPQSPLEKWLAGDTTYQQQLTALNQEQSAAQSNRTRQDQITNRNFSSTQRQMNTQAGQDRQNQQYDFAGRGILHSGVYAKALGDYNSDFQTKMNNLIQGRTDTLSQSAADFNDLLRQISLQKNSAKQDAIRRRQQELGIL